MVPALLFASSDTTCIDICVQSCTDVFHVAPEVALQVKLHDFKGAFSVTEDLLYGAIAATNS